MTDSSSTTPKPTARRLSIDYLLNPAAKTLDSKGCVINNKGGGLRPPMRPKHWDKKGATYPPPSWSSPQISPLRRNSVGVVQGDSGGRAGGISLPGIDSLSPFPGRRPTQGSDAGTTAPATPLSSPVLHRRTNNGSSEELPFIDVSSLENFCGQQHDSSAFEQRSEFQRRAGIVPSSSSSHSIYSPLSSPYPSPCPSPSYSFSSPSSTPMHSSPSSSPIPFLQRSLSPTFGGLFSDDSSSSSSSQLSDSGGESDTPAFKSASSFHARISSPSITIARASETPSSTLRPNLVSGSAFQSISHSAFSPVSSRRKDSSKAAAPPSPLAPEKSPATKKRLNEEMQASNLSSAFANWSISSSDEREDSNSGMEDNGPHAHSPPITRRNKKMREESPSSSPSIELGPASPLPSPSSSPFLSSAPNGSRARAAASKARGRKEKPKPEKDTESEEEEEEEDDKDDSKRKRATPEQVHILEQVFDMNPLPTAATKKELAKRIGMSHRQIQVWFQNKRARMKRMGQVPKCKDPFVFHHLAVCDDGEFSLKAEGHLPEEVENLLPAHSSKRK